VHAKTIRLANGATNAMPATFAQRR